MHPNLQRPALVEALSQDTTWQYDSTTVTVDAVYMDERVACYQVDADGIVQPDHRSANAAVRA